MRDSHKLRTLLKAANVEDEAVDKHLTVVQGDAKSDLEAAKATINGCDTIIFGIGTLCSGHARCMAVLLTTRTVCAYTRRWQA